MLFRSQANHASLIVIGAAHYSEPVLGLGRSVTTAVVEQASCSVYVVKGSGAVLATQDGRAISHTPAQIRAMPAQPVADSASFSQKRAISALIT